jgi:hypothetical protein
LDDVVTAYVADSAASAPAPRGLPLSLQAPSRHSAVASEARVPKAASGVLDSSSADDWDEAAAPLSISDVGGDEDGPPLEELEAQMQGDATMQNSTRTSPVSRRASAASTQEDDDDVRASKEPLPELDALVARLPAEVRETLDELFRARFVSVKRLPSRAFASAVRSNSNSRSN